MKARGSLKKYIHLIRNNAGSTLVTVLVVVAFMSILATVMLYLSGENYKMKVTDHKTKSSFYEAEEVLELMKAQMAQDVAAASDPAYVIASVDYVQSSEESIRSQVYYTEFNDALRKAYREHWYSTPPGGTETLDLAKGISYLFPGATSISADKSTKTASFNITVNGTELHCVLENFSFDDSLIVPTDVYEDDGTIRRSFLFGTGTDVTSSNGFELIVSDNYGTSAKRYTSFITTSFEITPPMLNWGSDVKNSDEELDYLGCVAYFRYNKE